MGQPELADRTTHRILANGAVGDPSAYWIRSAGHDNHPSVYVFTAGEWYWSIATNPQPWPAFRPTIWVHWYCKKDAYIPVNTDPIIWNYGAQATNAAWLSTPVQGSVVPDNPVFFLSEADIVQHMGQTTAANRRTNRIDANGNVGEPSSYWMRTVGSPTLSVARINNVGGWSWHSATTTGTDAAFRPTIWVRR